MPRVSETLFLCEDFRRQHARIFGAGISAGSQHRRGPETRRTKFVK